MPSAARLQGGFHRMLQAPIRVRLQTWSPVQRRVDHGTRRPSTKSLITPISKPSASTRSSPARVLMFKRSFANSERKTTTAPSTTLRRGAGADRVGAGPRSRPGRCEQAFDGVTSSGGPLAAATEPIRPPSGEEACLVPPSPASGPHFARLLRRGNEAAKPSWPR